MGILDEFAKRKAQASDMMDDVVRAAEEQGWKVSRTQKRHYQFIPPDPDLGMVHTSGTPSDYRAFNNFLSRLKQRGFLWPWDDAAREQFNQQKEPAVSTETKKTFEQPDYYAQQQEQEAKEDIAFLGQLIREKTPVDEINKYVDMMDNEKQAYRKAHKAK